MQIADLAIFFNGHVHTHVFDWLPRVDVEHVVIETQSPLENFMVGEVKGYSIQRRDLQRHSELVGFSRPATKYTHPSLPVDHCSQSIAVGALNRKARGTHRKAGRTRMDGKRPRKPSNNAT